jgi:hypothetical protein
MISPLESPWTHFHHLHQTDICLKFHVKTPYGWAARGGKKKKMKKKKKKKKKDHE